MLHLNHANEHGNRVYGNLPEYSSLEQFEECSKTGAKEERPGSMMIKETNFSTKMREDQEEIISLLHILTKRMLPNLSRTDAALPTNTEAPMMTASSDDTPERNHQQQQHVLQPDDDTGRTETDKGRSTGTMGMTGGGGSTKQQQQQQEVLLTPDDKSKTK